MVRTERNIVSSLFGATWLWGGLFLVAAICYGFSSGVRSEIVILLYVYALLGLGIYLPLELTDQVSLAYSAYFGIGAYSFAVCSAKGVFDPIFAIFIGLVLSGGLAAVIALSTSRLSGYFLTVATMLVGLTFERFLIQATTLTGGPTGLGFSKTLFGITISRDHLLIGGALIVWIVAAGLSKLRTSSTGKALLLLTRSWAAAESIGLETRRARIIALCIGASIASLAGSLMALSTGFVIPESYGMGISFLIIFIPIIGGTKTPWGSLVGAAVVCYVVQVAHQFGPSQLLFGLTTLVIVLLLPGGLLGGLQAVLVKVSRSLFRRQPDITQVGEPLWTAESIPDVPAMATRNPAGTKVVLSVKNISKGYGGVQALTNVSFEVAEGEIVGLVGPNGAGKSTLVDIITGVQTGDTGSVSLHGVELKEGPAFRAQRGMARTFQHPLLAPGLTVLDNVQLGLLRNTVPTSWAGLFLRFLRNMITDDQKNLKGRQNINESSVENQVSVIKKEFPMLTKSLNTVITDVSYGVEKLAESVRAIVSSPSLVLMDEPFAGLDPTAIAMVGRMLAQWRSRGLGAVVVDHNIDVLRDMCDRMVVLNYGEVIAVGEPREVLENAEVRRAYFGDE
jgi:branched-chain amino acid transport system permease protein